MARAALPPLPLRDGVGPSCVAVPGAGWPTVLDFLAERLPTLTRDEWQHRLDSGQVLDAQGHPVAAELPCRGGLRLFYYRGWADEPALDGAPEQIVFQDDWLVVADKPHFMPVTPGGRFVQRSLLVRLRRRLGIDGLSPIHRIDRETAGLVAFAVSPTRAPATRRCFATAPCTSGTRRWRQPCPRWHSRAPTAAGWCPSRSGFSSRAKSLARPTAKPTSHAPPCWANMPSTNCAP